MKLFVMLAFIFLISPTNVVFAANDSEIMLPRRDGKETPLRLYGDWNRCLPTMVLSHGMGGDDSGLAYVANAAAANGFRAAVMGHAESGRSALRGVLFTRKSRKEDALLNPAIWQGRFNDIEATLAYAIANCRPPLLVLAGHSMGAATTMLEAGARGAVAYGGADRFDAYVALSPQGVSWMFKDTSAWSNIQKPVLLITGTEDSMFNDDYQNRVKAFDYLPRGYKRIVIIDGADHMDFGGRGKNSEAQQTTTRAIFDYLSMLQQESFQAVSYPNSTTRDK